MDFIGVSSPDNLFSATVQQPQQLESLANSALKRGIDLYMRQDYKGAVKEFKRSLGLSQGSTYAVDAANYMADAYLALDDTENAIKAYKAAIRLAPLSDEGYLKLGNLYFSNERYDEAIKAYEKALKLNPSAANHFAMGQAYIKNNRFGDAELQFLEVQRMSPEEPDGHYGMGLNYSRQGRYEEAVGQFKQAVNIDPKFYDAFAEMGYAYADMGLMDEAQQQVDFLKQVSPELADGLGQHIYQVDPPKFMFAYADSSFRYKMPIKTAVAALDTYLETANASKTFTMKFQFDKQMDRESVENRLNWQIGRSGPGGPGEAYNFGLPVPDTEVALPPIPDQVIYDAKSMTATVYFTIRQNAAADGTIDPSHIEFQFKGKDTFGYAMDADADQFSGFSGVA